MPSDPRIVYAVRLRTLRDKKTGDDVPVYLAAHGLHCDKTTMPRRALLGPKREAERELSIVRNSHAPWWRRQRTDSTAAVVAFELREVGDA